MSEEVVAPEMVQEQVPISELGMLVLENARVQFVAHLKTLEEKIRKVQPGLVADEKGDWQIAPDHGVFFRWVPKSQSPADADENGVSAKLSLEA